MYVYTMMYAYIQMSIFFSKECSLGIDNNTNTTEKNSQLEPLPCSSASATPHHGFTSARCDVIKAGQRAVLPPPCQPRVPTTSWFSHSLGLQDVLNTRPVQRVFAWVAKDDRSPIIQHKVTSHL